MFKKYLSVFILLVLVGCQQDKQEWNPIFEETDFIYFDKKIEMVLSIIDDAYSEANINEQKTIQEKLKQAKVRLLQIKDYYVPLTAVRQKIYDAERYYKIDNIRQSKKFLNDSKSILTSLNLTTKSDEFSQVILELNSMIDQVILSFDEKSRPMTYSKMKKLGEHINLMLLKGDLVLSGTEFRR